MKEVENSIARIAAKTARALTGRSARSGRKGGAVATATQVVLPTANASKKKAFLRSWLLLHCDLL